MRPGNELIMKKLNKFITKKRGKLDKAQVAKLSGVSPAAVGKMEFDGYNPKLETLVVVLEALNTDLQEFFEYVTAE